METALLVAAVLVAGFACPAMMWWQRRRGRDAASCMPAAQRSSEATEAGDLRSKNEGLSAGLAELRGEPGR